jgi:hypothetical protein
MAAISADYLAKGGVCLAITSSVIVPRNKSLNKIDKELDNIYISQNQKKINKIVMCNDFFPCL